MSNTLVYYWRNFRFRRSLRPSVCRSWLEMVLTGRRAERLNALVEELSKQTEVHGLVVDVRDRQGMEAAIAGLPPAFAKLRG